MGGESWKCPKCDKWFLNKPTMRDHIRDKHNYMGKITWNSPNVICEEMK